MDVEVRHEAAPFVVVIVCKTIQNEPELSFWKSDYVVAHVIKGRTAHYILV